MNILKSYNKRFTIQNFLQVILTLLFVVVVTTCSTDTSGGGSGNTGGGSGNTGGGSGNTGGGSGNTGGGSGNTGGGSGGATTGIGAVGIAMEKVCTNKTMPNLDPADFSVLKPMLEPFSVTTNTDLNCIHFSENGSATATGDSWANALSTDQLKTKLNAISDASNSKVYILLLAKGTYTPTTLAIDETDAQKIKTARETSFTMKNHIAIIGGWNNAYAFNIKTYTSILSGDIGKKNDRTDNSYHVVFNNNLTSSAVLYGVTLNYGYADGASPHNFGGAIYNNFSHPTITQSSFSNNSGNDGGAIFNNTSHPTITQSSFSNNSVNNFGGAIFNNTSHPTITQSSFSNNSANNFGGAIYSIFSHSTITQSSFSTNSSNFGGAILSLKSYPTITQSSFSNNSANINGGAILNQSSHPTIIQSSFSTNSANQDGGAIYQNNDGKTGTTLANVILWDNKATNGSQIYLHTDGKGNENLILGSVILQDGTANIGFNSTRKPSEKQVSEHNIFTTDPGLGAFANNDGGLVKTFSISENSSAIDKGLYIKIKNDYSAFYYSSDSSTWYTTPVLAGTTTPLNTAVTPHTDSFKLATDARGYKFKGKPDIGDYEYNGIAPTP